MPILNLLCDVIIVMWQIAFDWNSICNFTSEKYNEEKELYLKKKKKKKKNYAATALPTHVKVNTG